MEQRQADTEGGKAELKYKTNEALQKSVRDEQRRDEAMRRLELRLKMLEKREGR